MEGGKEGGREGEGGGEAEGGGEGGRDCFTRTITTNTLFSITQSHLSGGYGGQQPVLTSLGRIMSTSDCGLPKEMSLSGVCGQRVPVQMEGDNHEPTDEQQLYNFK